MLPVSFYARPAEVVAEALLGQVLCVADGSGVHQARVVETEAYVGPHDKACHARVGVTPRTSTIYGPPGHAYVYFVYGMHHMLNVVTGQEGDGEAVLVRAAEPLTDIDARLDGPGRLTRGLGITVGGDNGIPLTGDRIWFEPGDVPPQVVRTPRIGVGFAEEWTHAPLRFVDAGSPCLSRPLRRVEMP